MSRRRVIIGAVIAAALTAGISACDSAGSAPTRPRASRVPTLPSASCGYLTTHELSAHTPSPGPNRALACFTAAARACKPASVDITVQGIDAGDDNLFRIDGGSPGACRVTDLSQFSSFAGGKYRSPYGNGYLDDIITSACRETSVTSEGVMLACGDGEPFLIPAG